MILLDTHAWIWWVSAPASLGSAARAAIRSSTAIGISAISCWEFAMLAARGRIQLDRDPVEWMEQALALPHVQLLPITPATAVRSTRLGDVLGGDPADRLIVATAILEGARIVTKDQRIRACGAVETVW